MPKFTLNVPHALGREEATRRLKERFHFLKEHYREHITSLEEQWRDSAMDFKLTTFGATIAGDAAVEEQEVRLAAHVPLWAAMFKSRFEETIRRELERILA